jgi:hypothetical protein
VRTLREVRPPASSGVGTRAAARYCCGIVLPRSADCSTWPMDSLTPGVRSGRNGAGHDGLPPYFDEFFRADTWPPSRPAAFFCAVVPLLRVASRSGLLATPARSPRGVSDPRRSLLGHPLVLESFVPPLVLDTRSLVGHRRPAASTGLSQLAFLDASRCFNSGSTSSARNPRPFS